MAMPTRRRRPLGAASRNRSGIEIVISPLPMLRLNTRIGGSARLLRPPSPARDAAAFGTKGLTTPALAPRARADTNAGLATVDDVRLTTRQTRVACRSLAAGGKPPPSNPRQAGALRAAPQLLAGERKQARALLLDRVKRRSLRLFCSGAVTRLGRRLVLWRLLLDESDRAPSADRCGPLVASGIVCSLAVGWSDCQVAGTGGGSVQSRRCSWSPGCGAWPLATSPVGAWTSQTAFLLDPQRWLPPNADATSSVEMIPTG
jgi:hypothetical protein